MSLFRRRNRPLGPWPGVGTLVVIVLLSFGGSFLALSSRHGWTVMSSGERWAWVLGGGVFCTACLIWLERRGR